VSKKSFATKLIEDRRLCLLRLLNEQSGRRANSSVLHMGLHHMAHVCERHDVIGDLRVLEHHQLIALEQVTETVYGAELLSRGEDFLAGHIEIDGISRPRRGL
jgi:hypothetical protein